jgi:hypothetical protein
MHAKHSPELIWLLWRRVPHVLWCLSSSWLQSLVRTFPGMSDYPLPEGLKGLAGVVVDSVNRCDTDVRKDLYQHVVLTGEGRAGGGERCKRFWWLTESTGVVQDHARTSTNYT